MKILVVEDDQASREVLAKLLRYSGHEVLSAENGLIALAQLEQTAPDVMLLDLMMPVMSGIEVLKFIRNSELWKSLRVVVISALSYGPELDIARSLGVETNFVKGTPYFNALLERIGSGPSGIG